MRRHILYALALAVLVVACGHESLETDPGHAPGAHRDLAELQRLIHTPRACVEHADCPTGSRCDGEQRCAWSCISDSECGAGRACDLYGACVTSALSTIAADVPACQAIPPAERRAAQLAIHDGQEVPCVDDDTCPCGAYCNVSGVCQVDCTADSPPPELACGAGLACTPLGRCANAPTDTGPPVVMTLALSERVTTRNTVAAPVVVPLTVTVQAAGLDLIDPARPAVVQLSIAEVREFEQGRTTVEPVPAPRVKCAAGDPLAAQCSLAGGWAFDIASGQLRSVPRTIWVEIPQTATALAWTLEARSEWADVPAIDVIRAEPVTIPATDPGHYRGALYLPNPGADGLGVPLPIEAVVTPTHVALIEPTRVALPDGQVVLSRDATKVTLLGWLAGDHAHYDVALALFDVQYDASNGHLDASLEVQHGAGSPWTFLMSFERTGEVDACPCGAGSYCNQAISRCLPGSGPPAGSSIVPAATAVPSATLPSSLIAAWSPAVETAASSSSFLGGAGITGIERAYCFHPEELGAARLSGAVNADTGDLMCSAPGLADYPAPTFGFANRTREYNPTTHFDLLESCLGDLDAQPTGPATIANLLSTRECASLGRFVLALDANAGTTLPDVGQRLVHQVLRQWLGASSYLAASAVRDRAYDDALSETSEPANARLGSALARVDRGLRVLLDASVRPQFAGAGNPAQVMLAPDYRLPMRPVTRWAFNGGGNPVPDVEGTNPFVASGVELAGELYAHAAPAATTCQSAQPVALGDRRFTIAANLRYVPATGTTTVVFDKTSPTGDRLWIEATTADAGAHLILTLKDSRGGAATFPAVETGFLAIRVEGASYRLYRTGLDLAATSIVNGGPRWGAAGVVKLACGLPTSTNVCTSWDRNTVGDALDVTQRTPYVEHSASWRRSCTTRTNPTRTTCTGVEPTTSTCPTLAGQRRQQLIAALLPNPPAWAVNQLTVTGALVEVATGSSTTPTTLVEWTDYRCDHTIAKLPVPVTAAKPVCGLTQPAIRWDEVSLWNRAVTREELDAMTASYGDNKASESLPPKLALAGKEQAAALPVHLLDAASADLALLVAYIAAERAVAYEECYAGTPSQSHVLGDVAGANLRLIAVIESEAERLAALPGAASAEWFARYQAARRQLAGRRARAVHELALAGECRNPLGIDEDDLPLYVGEEVGSSAKFFASSRFLTGKAREETTLAQQRLLSAQTKYGEQRQNAYQLDQAAESKLLRSTKLRADFESQLIRYCGKPAGTQKLLDGFLAGTLSASTCYIKTELPECAGAATRPLGEVPATCLRGDLGARLIAIQGSNIDMDNASRNHTRLIEKFDADTLYCLRRRQDLGAAEDELVHHQGVISSLRAQSRTAGVFGSFVNMAVSLGAAALTSNPALAFSSTVQGIHEGVGLIAGAANKAFDDAIDDENNEYELSVMRRSHELDIAACYHEVDNEKFQIDAARDIIRRAEHDLEAATFQLDSARNAVEGLLDEASGQLAIEAGIDSTPPHLHYWLDTEITEYQRHLAYARRLTYLALRAFEYEAQQTIGHRTETLTARRPDALVAVLDAIEARNAPMAGELGLVVGDGKVVLSLRDEVLGMFDVASSTHRLPGEPIITPEAAFRSYLRSDSARIFDASGRYQGQGIRFAMKPGPWTEHSCAERIWRLTTSLQIDNPPTQHGMVLYQENAFGSQDCRSTSADVIATRADSSTNVLTGDDSVFSPPVSVTPVNVDGPLGLDHESLRNRDIGTIAGLAGRGLYANYILLFPKTTWPDAQLAKVKDVLFRFDTVELTRP